MDEIWVDIKGYEGKYQLSDKEQEEYIQFSKE